MYRMLDILYCLQYDNYRLRYKSYYKFMKNIEEYNLLRDNLALGIARMADIAKQNKMNDKDFEDAFEYTLMQLKNFDNFFDANFNSFFEY